MKPQPLAFYLAALTFVVMSGILQPQAAQAADLAGVKGMVNLEADPCDIAPCDYDPCENTGFCDPCGMIDCDADPCDVAPCDCLDEECVDPCGDFSCDPCEVVPCDLCQAECNPCDFIPCDPCDGGADCDPCEVVPCGLCDDGSTCDPCENVPCDLPDVGSAGWQAQGDCVIEWGSVEYAVYYDGYCEYTVTCATGAWAYATEYEITTYGVYGQILSTEPDGAQCFPSGSCSHSSAMDPYVPVMWCPYYSLKSTNGSTFVYCQAFSIVHDPVDEPGYGKCQSLWWDS